VSDDHDALLRDLDRSVRWAERRARITHRAARVGEWVLESLAAAGSPWGAAAIYSPVWDAGPWRSDEPDAAEPR
jgi:hypothetical protein